MARPLTAQSLGDINTAFKTSFRAGFAGVTPLHDLVATRVPSTARTEKYTWLGAWPKIREWIGERVVRELSGHDYSITNKRFEGTVEVDGDDMRDDQIGIYGPMFEEQGRATAAFPDELVFAMLAAGFATKCYDGQYFFDSDHPVKDGSVSNKQDGAGPAWFLLDTSRSLKPLIFQDREKFDFVALDNPNDPNVFWKNKFVYGTTGRCNAGYGFWQMAFASKAELNAANYKAARAAMGGLKDDEGKPLGIRPTILVHGPSLEGDALQVLVAETLAGGGKNIWANTAKPVLVPWLE